MLFADYATATGETAIYPDAGGGAITALAYVSLGMVGETSEVKEKELTGDTAGLMLELGDVAWYLARAHVELGLSLKVDLTPPPAATGTVDELVVAVGKVAETVKKIIRDNGSQVTLERRATLTGTLDRVVASWVAVHGEHHLDPAHVLATNLAKLTSRHRRGVLAGSGDHR